MMANLRMCTFNCRSVKSSICEVKKLCNRHDLVLLQEHWLLPHDLNTLNDIHPEFLSVGLSAVDTSKDILVGRPYGGTAILYKKSFAASIKIVNTSDPRLCAIEILTSDGPLLILSVYMPTYTGDNECVENYIDTCAKITALYNDSSSINMIVAGDFNCQPGSRLFNIMENLIVDNNLIVSDIDRLNNIQTYFSDDGMNSTWIDHFVCSRAIDNRLDHIDVCYDYVSSDHKPLSAEFCGIYPVHCHQGSAPSVYNNKYILDWSKATETMLHTYRSVLDDILHFVDVPVSLFDDNLSSDRSFKSLIDNYYNQIINCIAAASINTIPGKYTGPASVHTVPGWNDIVEEKHHLAREAFLEWTYVGRPRHGPEFMLMKKTRASFKLALRYCKQHEEALKADYCAASLSTKDYNKFWNSIRKMNNSSTTMYVNSIGGAVGEANIASTWRTHFSELYNFVPVDGAQDKFYEKVKMCTENSSDINICMQDIANAIGKQKKGKATGPDDIATEALVFGGNQLCVHICMLFNLFIKFKYLPNAFMQSVIIPLIKCKSGDLTDVNNYRAIAISTSMSKLFESVIAHYFAVDGESDRYQFGFKTEHSTSLCTGVFKRTIEYYTNRGSHMFACFVDFTKA